MASSLRSKAFLGNALNGDAVAFGVEKSGGVVYHAMFCEDTARRLAQLNDAMPNDNWQLHKSVLEREGFDLSDPGDQSEN